MSYTFQEIEKKWQSFWKEQNTYRVTENQDKKKFYILDMSHTPIALDFPFELQLVT